MQATMATTEIDKGPIPNHSPGYALYYISFVVVFSFFFLNIFVALIILTFQQEGEREIASCELDRNQVKTLRLLPSENNYVWCLVKHTFPCMYWEVYVFFSSNRMRELKFMKRILARFLCKIATKFTADLLKEFLAFFNSVIAFSLHWLRSLRNGTCQLTTRVYNTRSGSWWCQSRLTHSFWFWLLSIRAFLCPR